MPPELLDRLPHGAPFRFLTRVARFEPKVCGEAVWTVEGHEAFFAGHFPGRPIVPGVLIAEALAQLSGLVGFDSGTSDVRLAQIDLKFVAPVAPPADILLQSRHIRTLGALSLFEVSAEHGGILLATGRVTLAGDDNAGATS